MKSLRDELATKMDGQVKANGSSWILIEVEEPLKNVYLLDIKQKVYILLLFHEEGKVTSIALDNIAKREVGIDIIRGTLITDTISSVLEERFYKTSGVTYDEH